MTVRVSVHSIAENNALIIRSVQNQLHRFYSFHLMFERSDRDVFPVRGIRYIDRMYT